MNPALELTVKYVLLAGALYVVLRVIDTAANYYMQSIGHIMGSDIETDMRRDLFSHLQDLSHSYYDSTKIGQIMSRITTDLNEITEFAHHFPEEMFIALIKIIVSFIIVAQMNPLLALIIFAVMPVMVFCSNIFSKRHAGQLSGPAPSAGRIERPGGGQPFRRASGQVLRQRGN